MNEVSSHLRNLRDTIDFLSARNQLIATDREVDPLLEVIGVAKACEDGPAILFNNVKGYPGHRILVNLFGNRQRLANIFGTENDRQLKALLSTALKEPVEPELTDRAPSHERVIREELDVPGLLPITKSIESDPGRIIGGGIALVRLPGGNHCVAFRRTYFRGPNWGTMNFNPGSHTVGLLREAAASHERIPLTLNIGCPPAVTAVASSGFLHSVLPADRDELGVAGRLQGFPVRLAAAKTVPAVALADAEWVVEGYLDPAELTWESEEAERTGSLEQPFFIEWRGYQGFARQVPRFTATALTSRDDHPIFYATVASGLECFTASGAFAAATYLELGHRIRPGLVTDANVLDGMHGYAGVVLQVDKRGPDDDTYLRQILAVALGSVSSAQLVVAVDGDVNIYSADDVWWAVMTRANPHRDILSLGETGSISGLENSPAQTLTRIGRVGQWSIDATVPHALWLKYRRRRHPEVNLDRWFNEREIATIRSTQGPYAAFIAEERY